MPYTDHLDIAALAEYLQNKGHTIDPLDVGVTSLIPCFSVHTGFRHIWVLRTTEGTWHFRIWDRQADSPRYRSTASHLEVDPALPDAIERVEAILAGKI